MLLDDDDEKGTTHPLQALNLNLLLHLDAVLRERSVSRAAGQLHLSQPTVSAALARLRRHFGDELLERRGHDLVLTPFGAALAPLAEQAVRSVGAVFDSSAVFEPSTSTRGFVIATPDVWVRVVGPPLGRAVWQRAPGVRLHFRSIAESILSDPADGMRSVDAVLCPHGLLSGVRHHDVFAAEWVFVASASNKAIGETLTVDDLRNLTWVAASGYSGGSVSSAATSLPMRELQQAGIEPVIAMTTDSFALLPELVAGTGHVALVPRSHAGLVAPGLDLRVLESPVTLRPLTQALWWHPAFDDDPGHRWLRRTVTRLGLG